MYANNITYCETETAGACGCAVQGCRQQDGTLAELFPPNAESSWLLLTCERADFAASYIAHAVEACNAHLLNLNVLAESPAPNLVAVSIRVGVRNVRPVIRSLARYGYVATHVDGYGFANPIPDDN